MSNVYFINKGKLNAGDINTITQAFNAVAPVVADKIHIYMDGSRARMDDRELLYLNQSLIKNITGALDIEAALAAGLIIEHLDQDNIYVKD